MGPNDILAEKDAIRELKARYFRCLDTKDWAEWRKVFADDLMVRVDLTPSLRNTKGVPAAGPIGADAFVKLQSERLQDFITVHHGHTNEITLSGPDTATGIWAMEDIVQTPDSDRVMRGYGHYFEQYRKVDGQWRIARMYLKRLRVDYFSGPPMSEQEIEAARGEELDF